MDMLFIQKLLGRSKWKSLTRQKNEMEWYCVFNLLWNLSVNNIKWENTDIPSQYIEKCLVENGSGAFFEDDGILKLAGQIDLIVKSGNDIYIIDHKTNGKIDLKSGFNTKTKTTAKMKYPLNNLDDCNFQHYTMQLSTYAWMLQKINPNFVIKDLILNHYDHEENNTLYHCEYRKHDVEKMLYHYKKKLILEKERSKRKRIEY